MWQGIVLATNDINDFTDFGSYFVNTGAINTPIITWGTLFVFPTNNEVLQFFLATTANDFGELYYRLRYNETTWTDWYYVTGTQVSN